MQLASLAKLYKSAILTSQYRMAELLQIHIFVSPEKALASFVVN